MKLDVKLGDEVHPEREIGRISQEDLKDTIRETRARLEQLEKEDSLLTDFEGNEKRTQEQAIDRLKQAINQIIENSREGLGIAETIVSGLHRLRMISQLRTSTISRTCSRNTPSRTSSTTASRGWPSSNSPG